MVSDNSAFGHSVSTCQPAADQRPRRSDGPLTADERARCREQGIVLAFDPVQNGWIPGDCEDDLALARGDQNAAGGAADRDAEGRRDLIALQDRFVLRPWRADEARVFTALLDNPEIWRYLPEPYPDPLTEQTARDLITLSSESHHHEVRAVELRGEVIGQVRLAFDPVAQVRHSAEISYWLGRESWGKGIGSDIVALYTFLSFRRHPHLTSIFARVYEDNRASARALQKAGYCVEGPAADDPKVIIHRARRDTLAHTPG